MNEPMDSGIATSALAKDGEIPEFPGNGSFAPTWNDSMPAGGFLAAIPVSGLSATIVLPSPEAGASEISRESVVCSEASPHPASESATATQQPTTNGPETVNSRLIHSLPTHTTTVKAVLNIDLMSESSSSDCGPECLIHPLPLPGEFNAEISQSFRKPIFLREPSVCRVQRSFGRPHARLRSWLTSSGLPFPSYRHPASRARGRR